MPPSVWGKAKTVTQFSALGLAMVRPPETWGPYFLDEWMMLVAVAATLASGWDYFKRYGGALRSRAQDSH